VIGYPITWRSLEIRKWVEPMLTTGRKVVQLDGGMGGGEKEDHVSQGRLDGDGRMGG
jgi:hypothetical protein